MAPLRFHEISPAPHRLFQRLRRSIQFMLQTSCGRAAPFGKEINVGAKILLGALLAFLAIPGAAWAALSVTAPPTAIVGQPVAIGVSSSSCTDSGFPINVSFGEGIPTTVPANATTTVSHAYPHAGSFTITADGSSAICSPSLATASILVVAVGNLNIAIVSGDNQPCVINTPCRDDFVVRVSNPDGSPFKGFPVTVTWQVTPGSGTFEGGTSTKTTTTNPDTGQASAKFTLGDNRGPVTVTASAAGGSVEFQVNDASRSTVTSSLQQAAALGNLAITTATVQSTNISLRLASLRAGQRGLSIKGLSLNVGGQPVPVAALASLFPALRGGGGASADQSSIFNRLGIFVTGQGTFGDQDPRGGEPGFDFHTTGTTIGADYRFTDRLALGTAFGYVSTRADFNASAGDFSANGYSASVFGTYFIQDKMYVDMIATYGWNDYDTTRNITFPGINEAAKGDPDGDQFALSVSTGYNFNAGGFTYGPTGRVNYIRAHVDEFRERGAGIFNVNVNDQTVRSVTVDLGGRISYAISMPFGVLLPSVHAEWEHEFKGGSRILTGSLVSDPAQTLFPFKTTDPDRNYVNVGTALTATLKGGSSTFVSYEAIVGRSEFIHHTFNAGIRFEFW